MFILKCLLWTSVVQSQDLKLSGWVSCSEWSCEKPIQEGIARLNFIGVKECSKIVFETVYGTIKYSSLHVTETSKLTNKTCCQYLETFSMARKPNNITFGLIFILFVSFELLSMIPDAYGKISLTSKMFYSLVSKKLF